MSDGETNRPRGDAPGDVLIETFLEGRPVGPLPAFVAGASPAYDLLVHAASVVAIGSQDGARRRG